MAEDLIGKLSGTNNPYKTGSYSAESNEKNTLTINSYFKLLASQLANQDMTNPMDNSEMMAQMTQMAMVQSVSAMTESIQTSTAISTQTYAAGLVGQEITVALTEENAYGQPVAVGVKYGKVESVNLTGSTPMLKLVGDDKEYPLSYVLGMGKIDDPYNKKEDDKTEKPEEGTEGTEKPEGGAGGTEKPEGGTDGTEKPEGGTDDGNEADPAMEKQRRNPLLDKGLFA